MHEYILNMHIHTRYSDGTGTHDQIAREAIDAGLDCIIITDHNVHVKGLESYVRQGGRKLIMLTGEEVHDQARQPQRNHLLVLGVDGEMAVYADQPQMLIDRVHQANGLSFIAHPIDLALPLFNEPEIPWDAWEVHNYTGIELWNGFSELKTIIRNGFDAVRYGLNFDAVAHSPHPAALHLWDDLTAQGLRVVAVGGSDAHRLIKKFGPFTRIIFPYRAHFQAVNTHILTADPLEWNNFSHDRKLIYQALQSGHCFIGYDLPASTRGFRFTVQTNDGIYSMGDQCELRGSVTLQIKLPLPTECRLIRDGRVIKIWKDQLVGAHITKEPGVYRVEAYIPFQGRLRGWIFSNPIYIRPPRPDRSFLTGPQWSQTTLPDF